MAFFLLHHRVLDQLDLGVAGQWHAVVQLGHDLLLVIVGASFELGQWLRILTGYGDRALLEVHRRGYPNLADI